MEVIVAIYKALAFLAARIPGEAWAALIAIGGVLLASRGARKEGAKQRLFEMRRTVYLEGAEAIARANTLIARMADLGLPDAEIGRTVNETIARLAKIQVVASEETVRAAADYMTTLTECLSALWPKRWELTARDQLLVRLGKQIDAATVEVDRWQEEIRQLGITKDAVDYLTEVGPLQRQLNSYSARRAALVAEHERLRLVQAHEALTVIELCLQQSVPMLEAVPRALSRVRAELDLPGSEATIRQILQASAVRQATAVRALADRARAVAAGHAANQATPQPTASR